MALEVGDDRPFEQGLIVPPRLVTVDERKSKLVQNCAGVCIFELDGLIVSSGKYPHEASTMLRLAVRNASEFFLEHVKLVCDGGLDLFDTPVFAAGAQLPS